MAINCILIVCINILLFVVYCFCSKYPINYDTLCLKAMIICDFGVTLSFKLYNKKEKYFSQDLTVSFFFPFSFLFCFLRSSCNCTTMDVLRRSGYTAHREGTPFIPMKVSRRVHTIFFKKRLTLLHFAPAPFQGACSHHHLQSV